MTYDLMAWSRAFDDPITLPEGRVLKTLHDAGHYVAALSKATQQRVKRQTAAEILVVAAARVTGRRCLLRSQCCERCTPLTAQI